MQGWFNVKKLMQFSILRDETHLISVDAGKTFAKNSALFPILKLFAN